MKFTILTISILFSLTACDSGSGTKTNPIENTVKQKENAEKALNESLEIHQQKLKAVDKELSNGK